MTCRQPQSLLDSLIECARVCDYTGYNYCMGQSGMEECGRLCFDCASICWTMASYATRQSCVAPAVARACAEICGSCADECARFEETEMQHCAEVCRRCAEECRSAAAVAVR
ncbi:MAG: four-helix bundle copper-binding protein [Chloroflexi bacterium]|nr:four-helix bundle copper-binding protein [Chloroflexota bacterium]